MLWILCYCAYVLSSLIDNKTDETESCACFPNMTQEKGQQAVATGQHEGHDEGQHEGQHDTDEGQHEGHGGPDDSQDLFYIENMFHIVEQLHIAQDMAQEENESETTEEA